MAIALIAVTSAHANAAETNSIRELPTAVKAKLVSLAECSAKQPIYPDYRGSFEFCGGHVDWVPDRASALKACLADRSLTHADKVPSYRIQGATTYSVVFRCSDGSFANVDVEVAGGTAQISNIGEWFSY